MCNTSHSDDHSNFISHLVLCIYHTQVFSELQKYQTTFSMLIFLFLELCCLIFSRVLCELV